MKLQRYHIKRLSRLAAEALAIFVGVTAGFFADDYRDARHERGRSREAILQLVDDLALDAADLTPILPRSRLRVESMRWLHNNIDREDVPPDSVRAVVSHLG